MINLGLFQPYNKKIMQFVKGLKKAETWSKEYTLKNFFLFGWISTYYLQSV
jgi:hypothetical protein